MASSKNDNSVLYIDSLDSLAVGGKERGGEREGGVSALTHLEQESILPFRHSPVHILPQKKKDQEHVYGPVGLLYIYTAEKNYSMGGDL